MTDTAAGPELSIVVPTFNERGNVRRLIAELSEQLAGLHWEVIFVDDDSPDATSAEVRWIAAQDARVRCVERIGRRGLATACIEGMLTASAPLLLVMDGDLQHDPKVIPEMVDALRRSGAELVVASRYTEGGQVDGWAGARRAISRFATRLGHVIVPAELKDPMSGFFLLRRSLLDEVKRRLSGIGFKILLDIFASARRPIDFREVPFAFRARLVGESKLDSLVALEYLMLLADKGVGRYVPVRFLTFSAVGGLGVAVHLIVLKLAFGVAGLGFAAGQAAATAGAMVFNYTLNNTVTHRDQRRTGWRWLRGLASFMAVCSVGGAVNVGIAAQLFQRDAGWIVAALAGVLVGALWNYVVTDLYIWRRR